MKIRMVTMMNEMNSHIRILFSIRIFAITL